MRAMLRTRAALCAALICGAAALAPLHAAQNLPPEVLSALQRARVPAGALSVVVQDVGGGRPVLLRLEYDSGHGQGSTRAQAQARTADVWSFMLWQFGVPEYQPKPSAPAR